MKGAQIIKTNQPLEINDIKDPKPEGKQVLVKVIASGVCHSDLHLWEGGYAGPKGVFMKVEDRGVKFPLIPGHEISGEIEEVGNEVSNVQVGDNVLVYPWLGEGSCPACLSGEQNLCDSPKTLGIYQNGGYAQFVLVPDSKYVIKLSNLQFDSASSLACSGLTAYNAVKKAKPAQGLEKDHNIVIVGAGGLGLMAVQIAKAICDSNITVIDVNDQKLSEARKLGADTVINSKEKSDIVKEVKALTNGAGTDVVIDFVNNNITSINSFNMLRKRGKMIMVGLFGGSMELNLPMIPLRGYTLTGAYTGTFSDLTELVNLASQGKVKTVLDKRYSLDQVNEALEDLKNGKIIGRAIINPN
ncbi:alcohol dehydrogenase [Candidatus Nitrosocosmicus franklandus]|uniref:NAD-dependent alcohol dehydrogenase n=1 Tax=Candidatus Nitrosocosmicus franklandianus TaxID=1798806 RepID=A0A484IBY6_9ARCH|nr:alcohol dehydrogenase [Candidatus Nitrosocosmicus franklandus]VFJ15293.1 NAD-dependent alcohol dehydrogenase [Candidatus Nitrosocosmicus franklandus]